MKNKISYWMYLEPYTFIFSGKADKVLYNTLNSAYLKCTDPNVIKLLNELSIQENGYCVPVTNEMAKDKSVVEFIRYLRSSFSGNVISSKIVSLENKPFIFMPMMRLYNSVEKINKEKGLSLGEVILRNLNEVTCFMPGSCNHGCDNCKIFYRQITHCSNFTENQLSIDDYFNLFDNLIASGVNKINIVINELANCWELFTIIEKLRTFSIEKEFYLDVKNLNENIHKLFIGQSNVNISIDFSNFCYKEINEILTTYKDYPIIWNFIVTDEFELDNATKLSSLYSCHIIPFYNKINVDFFKEYVYLTLDDIIEIPIGKRQIYRRQSLNENFFGKLFILPSGDVYSNMNLQPIGSIPGQSLSEIVFSEFSNSQSWLNLRDKGACKDCANKYLCPSVSNYEYAIGKVNLCHINN